MTTKLYLAAGAAALAAALAFALPNAAAAQESDHHSQCVAIGVEIGTRADDAQTKLDDLQDDAGDDISADDKVQIDDLKGLLDNLHTISDSMTVLYDAEKTPPTEDEMETVNGADINDLLDAANECINNAD